MAKYAVLRLMLCWRYSLKSEKEIIMKKILCLLLVLLLISGTLAGCSKKDNEVPSGMESAADLTPAPMENKGPYRIGLIQYMEYGPMDEARAAFISRLDEWGFDDSKVSIDYQNVGGDMDKTADICKKFVEDKVDLIVAISTPAAKAAIEASKGTDVQVVFMGIGDPQTELEIGDISQTDSGVTGVSELVSARASLDLARQINPELGTIGLLFDPGCSFGTAYIKAMREYCSELEITIVDGQVTDQGQVKERMIELCGQVEAVFSPMDSTVSASAKDAAMAAIEKKKPWYVSSEDMVKLGAFASISIDQTEAGNKAADIAVQLVCGKEISQLPIYSFTNGRLSVNQTCLSKLELDVPNEILDSASLFDLSENLQE